MIGRDHWSENPLFVLPRWSLDLVRLWLRCRRYGGGGGLVPSVTLFPAGGAMGDQPAAMLDAFDILERIARERNGESD